MTEPAVDEAAPANGADPARGLRALHRRPGPDPARPAVGDRGRRRRLDAAGRRRRVRRAPGRGGPPRARGGDRPDRRDRGGRRDLLARLPRSPGSPRGGDLHFLGILYRMRIVGGELRDEVDGTTDTCAWISPRRARRHLRLVELAAVRRSRLALPGSSDGRREEHDRDRCRRARRTSSSGSPATSSAGRGSSPTTSRRPADRHATATAGCSPDASPAGRSCRSSGSGLPVAWRSRTW